MPVLCVLLTAHEVANLLRISTKDLNALVAKGDGPEPFTRDGYLFHPQIVETYLAPGAVPDEPSFDMGLGEKNDATALLTPIEAAGFMRSSVSVLARWRVEGKGPVYVKSGGRVFYDTADLETFINQSKRDRTRPAPPPISAGRGVRHR